MNIIETDRLTKRYGHNVVVDSLSFNVERGSVLGIVGIKGSGKTTLLRMLATLLAPTSGDALINGSSIVRSPRFVRQVVGYMPAESGVYSDMGVREYLEFFGACHGVALTDAATVASDLLQLVDLFHKANEPVERLSPGMTQRLGLARSLIHDPGVLLLDEPTSNLDPKARVEMRELIHELRSLGKTILITAHIVADIQDVCTGYLLLENGSIKRSGSVETIQESANTHRFISIKLLGDIGNALQVARMSPGVLRAEPFVNPHIPQMQEATMDGSSNIASLQQLDVLFDSDFTAASNLLKALVRGSVQVVSFHEREDVAELQSPSVERGREQETPLDEEAHRTTV